MGKVKEGKECVTGTISRRHSKGKPGPRLHVREKGETNREQTKGKTLKEQSAEGGRVKKKKRPLKSDQSRKTRTEGEQREKVARNKRKKESPKI